MIFVAIADIYRAVSGMASTRWKDERDREAILDEGARFGKADFRDRATVSTGRVLVGELTEPRASTRHV